MKRIVVPLLLLSLINFQAYCQENTADTTKSKLILAPYHKNVIKFNPTPMLLFGQIKNITFSYERLIKDNQSVAGQLGYLSFDGILKDTVAGLILFTGNHNQPGYNMDFDYRYYLFARNRRPAPDGVYIGGYASYYGFKLHNNFDILATDIDQNGEINGSINAFNLGFLLGYQFIFWKRMSVDLMVFGPSLLLTTSKGEIKGDLDADQIGLIDEELVQKIIDQFPALGEVFSDENLSFTNNRTKFGMGFRYSIQIGYHF